MEQLQIPKLTTSPEAHISTTWQIASDVLFENIVYEVIESIENKTILNIPGTLNKFTTYYARAKRHYQDSTVTTWLPYEVINIDSRFGLATYNVEYGNVETPSIYINKEEWFDDTIDSVTINCSKIRTNGSSHKSTTWIIYGDNNEILFKSLEDKVNLESIVIPKSYLDIYRNTTIIIKALHLNTDNFASNFGEIYLPSHESAIRILGNFKGIPVNIDHTFNIYWSDFIVVKEIDYINIFDSDDNNIFNLQNITDVYFKIPAYTLNAGENYTIKVVTKSSGIYGVKEFDIQLTTSIDDYEYVFSPSYKYDFKSTETIVEDTHEIKSRYYIEALRNFSVIYTRDNEDHIYMGRFNKDTGKIVHESLAAFIPTAANKNFNVLEIDHYRIFIDSVNTNDERVFSLVEYDLFGNVITVKYNEVLPNELTTDIGFNAITHHKGTNYIYFDSHTNDGINDVITTKRFDIVNRVIETLDKRLGGDYINSTLEYIGDGKILSVGSTNANYTGCFIYDTVTEKWDNIKHVPSSFLGHQLISSKIKNGNIVFFKENDVFSRYLEFDIKNFEFIEHTDYVNAIITKGIIVPHNGDIIISDKIDLTKYYTFS